MRVGSGFKREEMESWLSSSYLTNDEKSCGSCHVPFLGNEELNIRSDGNVVVKYVECSNCKTVLVLDVARHNELFPV